MDAVRRDIVRRVVRRFAGVEFLQTRWQPDGTAVLTFVTYDDNADEVIEYLGARLDEAYEDGVEVLVMPIEQISPR
ncbi:MAG: hypothetical protein HY303_12330 [Candidatus Wallbacteria bacterium]|nr:hypothetical protein [Candidatus Wallbacteria bacterium]